PFELGSWMFGVRKGFAMSNGQHQNVCPDVWSIRGEVTSFLREHFGWHPSSLARRRTDGHVGPALGTNWSPLAGSTTNTQMSIPMGPTSSGVFYRLHCR